MKNLNENFNQVQECEVIRSLLDGALVLKLSGKEQVADIYGIEISQPPPQEYFEWVDRRLMRVRKPLRCSVRSRLEKGRIIVQLFAFNWQDKSGDVWLDIGPALLREGIATVASEDFPERKEYLRCVKIRVQKQP